MLEEIPQHQGVINVLHIEDNAAYSRLIQEYLHEEDAAHVNVFNCAKISEALSFIERNPVDVILLDLSLPDSTGIQSVNLIHKRAPDKALVVLTGTNNEETGFKAVQLGAQDFLVKDFCEGGTLLKTIRYAMERQRIETKIRDQAMTDGLTLIPNRARFMEYLDQAMSRAQRLKTKIVLLYIDFDGFKQINDTYGHGEGDACLKEFSRRLNALIRSSDFCARLGGDEFAVVSDIENHSLDHNIPFMEKILEVMRIPHTTKSGDELSFCCSIGAALFCGDEDKKNSDQFIQYADEAMYRAKANGGDCYRLFDSSLTEYSKSQSNLILQLRSALSKDQFYLEFQPIVSSNKNTLKGVEALLRWKTDDGAIIPPEDFILYLEKNKMIHSVGEWVLDEACRLFHQHFGDSEAKPWLSVNISPLQLHAKTLISAVERNLALYKIPHSWLHLEITERVIMKDTARVMKTLQRLIEMGVVTAIDDFGTGYSSMQYLMELPAQIIKIDQSFVAKVADSRAHQLIVKGMIQLAHALDKEIVVEGVETKIAAATLSELQADYFQGFLYARPAAIDLLRPTYRG
ncbi:MAG: EAL domain-containing protein [Agarilytica sp.]